VEGDTSGGCQKQHGKLDLGNQHLNMEHHGLYYMGNINEQPYITKNGCWLSLTNQLPAREALLEYGLMPSVMATQLNIGGALCKSFVIPFLVPRHKVWLTAAARVPCSNASNIGEN